MPVCPGSAHRADIIHHSAEGLRHFGCVSRGIPRIYSNDLSRGLTSYGRFGEPLAVILCTGRHRDPVHVVVKMQLFPPGESEAVTERATGARVTLWCVVVVLLSTQQAPEPFERAFSNLAGLRRLFGQFVADGLV